MVCADPAAAPPPRHSQSEVGSSYPVPDLRTLDVLELVQARKILDYAGDAFIGIDADGIVTHWNREAERIFGFSAREAVGASMPDLIMPAEYRADHDAGIARFKARGHGRVEGRYVELEALRKNGDRFPAEMAFWGLKQDGEWNFYSFIRDISDRKARDAELLHRARHDDVTGLNNRAALLEILADLRLLRDHSAVVLLIEVDRFKALQDGLGHRAVDEMLRELAARLRACRPDNIAVARVAESEFVLVVDAPRGAEVNALAARFADTVRHRLQQPISLSGDEISVDVTVGVAVTPADRADEAYAESVLRDMAAGVHEARADGAGGVVLIDHRVRSRLQERLRVERELAAAIPAGQLRAYYQPVVRMSDGAVVGAEALVRWQHPERGLLGPAAFIEIAEESGLIVELGSWMLREATAQARRWQDAGHTDLRVAVNLSARQFAQADLVGEIAAAQRDAGLRPDGVRLLVEITETLVMNDPVGAVSTMRQLQDLDVGLALDDFGTGYSSLAYLKTFPMDVLKIDRTFVTAIDRDPRNAAIVTAVTELGHALGLTVLAEGVETVAERDVLAAVGCDLAQGFLFGRPAEPASLTELFVSGVCV